MSTAERRLLELLERERAAALCADVETLVELQGQKREALDALQIEGGKIDCIVELARANIHLLIQLVAAHRAFHASEPPNAYGADGREHVCAAPHFRSTL